MDFVRFVLPSKKTTELHVEAALDSEFHLYFVFMMIESKKHNKLIDSFLARLIRKRLIISYAK